MALSYKKDLGKYKDIDEDELLNKLSAEELKQLETALEEMDPEVRTGGLEEFQGSLVGGRSYGKGIFWEKCPIWNYKHFIMKACEIFATLFYFLQYYSPVTTPSSVV